MKEPPWNSAVAALFDAHSRALLLYARQWVGTAAAEDVVQAVFVRLVRSRRLPDEPRTWLFRCVRNEAISHRRSEDRRSRRQHAVATEAKVWFVADAENRLNANEVQAALETLPSEHREVLVLRLWSELTLAEISAITGSASSTVHARYAAAIESLRRKLEASCSNPKK